MTTTQTTTRRARVQGFAAGCALVLVSAALTYAGLSAWADSLPDPAVSQPETVEVPGPTVTVALPAPTVTVTATPAPEPATDAGVSDDGRWIEYVENDGYPYAVAHGYDGNFTAAREAIGNRLGCDENAPVADDDWGDDGIMGYCEPALAY